MTRFNTWNATEETGITRQGAVNNYILYRCLACRGKSQNRAAKERTQMECKNDTHFELKDNKK